MLVMKVNVLRVAAPELDIITAVMVLVAAIPADFMHIHLKLFTHLMVIYSIVIATMIILTVASAIGMAVAAIA